MPKYQGVVSVGGRRYVSIKYIAEGYDNMSPQSLRYLVFNRLEIKPALILSGRQYFSDKQLRKIEGVLEARKEYKKKHRKLDAGMKIDGYKSTNELAEITSKSPASITSLLKKNGFVPRRVELHESGGTSMFWDKSATGFCISYYSRSDNGQKQTLFTIRNMATFVNEARCDKLVEVKHVRSYIQKSGLKPKCQVTVSNCKTYAYGPDVFELVRKKFVYDFYRQSELNDSRDVAILQDRLMDEETQNKKLQESVSSYHKQIQKLSENIKDLSGNARYNGKLRSLPEMRGILNRRDEQIAKCKKEIGSYKRQFAKFNTDRNRIDELMVRVDTLEARNRSLRKALNAETDSKVDLNSKIQMQKNEVSFLLQKREDLTNELENLRLELENLKKVNHNLEEENSAISDNSDQIGVWKKLKLIFESSSSKVLD